MFEKVELFLHEFDSLLVEKTKAGGRGHCKLELDCVLYFIQVMLVGLVEAPGRLTLLQPH